MNDLHATFPVILVELNVTYFVVAVVVFFCSSLFTKFFVLF